MTTNATVDDRHKDEAAKAAGYPDWEDFSEDNFQGESEYEAVVAHAQALANLEAARAENADLTNRLAEIETKAWEDARDLVRGTNADLCKGGARQAYMVILDALTNAINRPSQRSYLTNLASGHTPSPCPSCAAKDEAMAAFKAEVSDAIQEYCGGPKYVPSGSLSRFIIPPADPVAEALKAAWTKLWPEDTGIPTACQALRDELAKHGLELSRLGGAK